MRRNGSEGIASGRLRSSLRVLVLTRNRGVVFSLVNRVSVRVCMVAADRVFVVSL